MTGQFSQAQLKQRLDVAKGAFTMPDEIDSHEVVALFLGEHDHATSQSIGLTLRTAHLSHHSKIA